MPTSTNGALARLDAVLAELDRRAADCAARCKVTLWAYYGRAADDLRLAFAQTARTAEALIAQAADECPNLVRDDAARLWAAAVYARKIVGRIDRETASLQWLRDRANVRRPRLNPAQADRFVELAVASYGPTSLENIERAGAAFVGAIAERGAELLDRVEVVPMDPQVAGRRFLDGGPR